ncbi:pyrBI operon leader peptide [Kluyvera sp. STS39-E]|uniref:pyrBI operon leader peptide n=1 Tax=Kluyvera sp. STS39-E TaxID=3234748 RepID=UPI0034C669B1
MTLPVRGFTDDTLNLNSLKPTHQSIRIVYVTRIVNSALDCPIKLRIILLRLPGGNMVQCVRHRVLPRLKTDAGLPFFLSVASPILKAPYLRGFFFAPSSGDNHG